MATPDTNHPSTDEKLAEMRGELRDISRWAETMSNAMQERNRAIRAAMAAGRSQRETARAAGLTHPAVRKILKRTDKP